MASDSELLAEKLSHLHEKLDDMKKSIEKVDSNVENLREKIEAINTVKIPSITEELSALRTKAAVAGGVFGAIGTLVVGLILWIVESFHVR